MRGLFLQIAPEIRVVVRTVYSFINDQTLSAGLRRSVDSCAAALGEGLQIQFTTDPL